MSVQSSSFRYDPSVINSAIAFQKSQNKQTVEMYLCDDLYLIFKKSTSLPYLNLYFKYLSNLEIWITRIFRLVN